MYNCKRLNFVFLWIEVDTRLKRLKPWTNPTTVSYNAIVKKITAQLIAWRVFRMKIFFRWCKKAIAYYNAGAVAVN
jgi:hypothetical protein